MNIFRVVLFNVILLLFPLLIYLIYLSSNKNINKKAKSLYNSLALITSFFLMIEYGFNTSVMSILLLNCLVILSYIEDKVVLANIFSLVIIFIYRNQFTNLYFLLIIYILFLIIYFIKKKIKLNDYVFLDILAITSSVIYIIWIYLFNKNYFDIKNLLIIIISYIFIINITRLVYETSEKILTINTTLKELEKEKQIRLSLFKITHEIKNPIAVCKGYLDMLNTKDTNQVERYIPILKSEIDRLLSLLQDFLLINKSNLDLDVMDINMLVEETIDKLKPLLDENNIKLDLNLIDDEIYINGDFNRLSQVLINIIKNSIESINTKGKITINSSIKNNKCYISIKDNGCGMSKEILDKIKEPFFTTKKRGSGLGVALIYEIIEAHGAKINYDSEYGKGTKVDLVFSMYQ